MMFVDVKGPSKALGQAACKRLSKARSNALAQGASKHLAPRTQPETAA